jgi:thiamine pyrophosphokinase
VAHDIAYVFAGGDAPGSGALADLDGLNGQVLVIAADSGLAHARAAGLGVDVVVGDLDSVDPVDLEDAAAAGTTIERHPADKDATDLELALATARRCGARRVVVVGAEGGRVDHFLANALLLAAPAFADLEIEARLGRGTTSVVRGGGPERELRGAEGDLVTLLPVGGAAQGVHTEGLRWALRGETLAPGTSRGVSNELVVPVARVRLASGVLLAVQPGEVAR